ncbi:MAG: hypothetical protein AMXMBFR84_33250 [Candidatus Hydrogenedentota bacterium]
MVLETLKFYLPRFAEMPFAIFLAVTFLLCPVIVISVRHVLALLVDLQMAHLELLVVLGNTVAKRDQDTAEHNFRVAIMAVQLAEAARLDAQSMLGQFTGAFLHDIGKIGVSDNILLKPGSLTDDERGEMQKHVLHGVDILTNSVWLQEATRVIGFHHEKFDGSGYPYGLKSADIPVEARIFSIVDVFDALVSARPYKDAMPFEQAIKVMQQEDGKSFDPQYLCTFLSIAQRLYHQVIGLDLAQLKAMCAMIVEEYSGQWSEKMV